MEIEGDIENTNVDVPDSIGNMYFRYLHLHPIRINITFTMEGDANISDLLMGNNSSSSYNPVVHIVKTFINSFGTSTKEEIWKILSDHLDICRIEVNGSACDYDYTWTDIDHEVRQMRSLGYIQ